MSDNVPAPLGAIIVIDGGQELTVHPECKEVRDRFTLFLRKLALEQLDVMLKEKLIEPAEYALRKGKVFHPTAFAYGTSDYSDSTESDIGIKRLLFERVRIGKPDVLLAVVEAWVDQHGWQETFAVMAQADGFHPKSNSRADGQSS